MHELIITVYWSFISPAVTSHKTHWPTVYFISIKLKQPQNDRPWPSRLNRWQWVGTRFSWLVHFLFPWQEKVESGPKRDIDGMGVAEIKYGDSVCFVMHVSTGLWLSYQAPDAKSSRLGPLKRRVSLVFFSPAKPRSRCLTRLKLSLSSPSMSHLHHSTSNNSCIFVDIMCRRLWSR